MTNSNLERAKENFATLARNPYPGRGIVVGLDETGEHLIQIYWIMGRSENSRNRIFKADDDTGRLYTEAADATKMRDPSLVIYNAMREIGPYFIVSNGIQTDAVAETQQRPLLLNEALGGCAYEPDPPNFTQRITAISSMTVGRPYAQLSILRKSPLGDQCDRAFFVYLLERGFGHCVTTYAGDGNPLPPFCGDPLPMPLSGTIEEMAKTYWDALDEENRVSLAVKFVDMGNRRSDIHIINKFKQAA